MVARNIGAALAAGCAAVWKPAGKTLLSTLRRCFQVVATTVITMLDNVAEVGGTLCKSKVVRKIKFWGSARAGKLLPNQCSPNLTKLSLELGGNSPFIVLEDVKIETAVEASILANFRTSGRPVSLRIASSVQGGIYDQFSATLVEKVKTLRVGSGGVEKGYVHWASDARVRC